MNTAQNYAGKGDSANPTSPTVENDPNTPVLPDNRQPVTPLPITAAEFITRHADLRNASPGELFTLFSEYLTATPVRYNSVLDGIALLRAFIPTKGVPAHYALMLHDWTITGFLCIAADSAERYDTGLLLALTSETRPLITGLLSTQAERVLLATTRTDDDYGLTDGGFRWIDGLLQALEIFDVEMLDYLLLYHDANVSRTYEAFGVDGLDDGVDINVMYEYAITSGPVQNPLS